ncbi:MAG TPA: hypothetical protein VIM62_07430 [Acidobacteriaceae bacterium]
MPVAENKSVHKHFRLNQKKLKLAQKVLNAPTETETVERALDLAISEYERNKVTQKAHREFLMSGAKIRDVFGALDE